MPVEVRLVGRHEAGLLSHVAPAVFDDPIDPARAEEFLADPRHHLVVAIDKAAVVGFASAIHYLHPDKARPELWINEIGVAPAHRNRGLGRRLLDALLDVARRAGCAEAWVLTDPTNAAAIQLYSKTPGAEAPAPQLMFTFSLEDR